jgi:hypothetical protein
LVVGVEIEAVDLIGDLFCREIAKENVPCGVLLLRDSCDVPWLGSSADGRGFAVMPAKRVPHGGLLVQRVEELAKTGSRLELRNGFEEFESARESVL